MPVEPNTKTTFVLVADWNSRPSSSNAGVRSAAAATVISSGEAVVAYHFSLCLHAVTHTSAKRKAASVSSRKIIGRVEVYLRATHLVSFQHAERRRIHVNRDQILTTIFGISESMNV